VDIGHQLSVSDSMLSCMAMQDAGENAKWPFSDSVSVSSLFNLAFELHVDVYVS